LIIISILLIYRAICFLVVKYPKQIAASISEDIKLLLELRVRDLGIIEEMSWCPAEGLNVITGETGAGKSLVIDAVELLLGVKGAEDVIRHGAEQARIEAVFDLSRERDSLQELLEEKALGDDEDTLVIGCEVRRRGPGSLRVNGHTVPRSVLRRIGGLLVDIHGQSEHLSLLDSKTHLDYLDAFAHTMELREEFNARAVELSNLQQELRTLENDAKEHARREEYLRFQIDEINRARLKDGEEMELERERNILASTEKLKAISYEAYCALYGADDTRQAAPALERLSEAARALKKLVEVDAGQAQQLALLEGSIQSLTELARDVRGYSERMEYDPERLDEVITRLETITGLKRKYGQTIADILDYLTRAERELEDVQSSAERRTALEKGIAGLKREMGDMASRLSNERAEASVRLTGSVKNELRDLSMSRVEFEVHFNQQPADDGIPLPDGKTYAVVNGGVDTVEFLVSTNPGEPLQPLARIASTGEISRFTLALKGALSGVDNIPVLIFDEIDIGIGGRSGEIIGEKLCRLARDRQVICVTHLPQIAAFADAHFSVHKEVSGSRTLSLLQNLNGEARIGELAEMLAGPQYTATSLKGAREIRLKAEAWKKANIK
jgi:DNA repair protein RecN (Recombination protein N)